MQSHPLAGNWALILGASSGFGAATAIELAKNGINIFGVHLDRKATMPNVGQIIQDIESTGAKAIFFNINASDETKRAQALDKMQETMDTGETIKILMHSLAFGALRSFIGDPKARITKPQMDMTIDVMANSLIYWTQDVIDRSLMNEGGRIYAMTSSGSSRVWLSYGGISAAKAALESNIRQLALELTPKKITANAILAGVTDTPALRKIPGHEKMIEIASKKNPSGRLTTPEDVAKAITVLSHPNTYWMTGNVIHVDGGENIVD